MQFDKSVVSHSLREQVEKVLADILSVKVSEASESLAVKENQDGDDLGIGKPSRLIAMLLAITELMLFEFRRKILAEIIGKTENFSNFVLGNHSGKCL